jgi:hypothetical protein
VRRIWLMENPPSARRARRMGWWWWWVKPPPARVCKRGGWVIRWWKPHPRLAFASEEGGGGHWPAFHSNKMKINKMETFIFKKTHT